jgi:hypothetical protein
MGTPITVYGSDYVAIRWQGKIRPDYTEPFVFYANMDDGARVWIDKVLIADSWGVCCNETWGTANLTKDFLHDIIVEYKQLRGAWLSFFWFLVCLLFVVCCLLCDFWPV